jgi:hypothetical protein
MKIECFETVFFGGVIFLPLLAAVAQAVPTIGQPAAKMAKQPAAKMANNWSTSGEKTSIGEPLSNTVFVLINAPGRLFFDHFF